MVWLSVVIFSGCTSSIERRIYRYVDHLFPDTPEKDTCIIDMRKALKMDYDNLYSIYEPTRTDFSIVTGIEYPKSVWTHLIELFHAPTDEEIDIGLLTWDEKMIVLTKDSCLISHFVNTHRGLIWNLKKKTKEGTGLYYPQVRCDYGHEKDWLYVVERTYRETGLLFKRFKSRYRLTPLNDYVSTNSLNSYLPLTFYHIYPTDLTFALPIIQDEIDGYHYYSYWGGYTGNLCINYDHRTAILSGLGGEPIYYGSVDVKQDSLHLRFNNACRYEDWLSILMSDDESIKDACLRSQKSMDEHLEEFFSRYDSLSRETDPFKNVFPPKRVLRNKRGDYLVLMEGFFELTLSEMNTVLLGNYCIKKIDSHWEIWLKSDYIRDLSGDDSSLVRLNSNDPRNMRRILKIRWLTRSLQDITTSTINDKRITVFR